jgi:hypothetical protein
MIDRDVSSEAIQRANSFIERGRCGRGGGQVVFLKRNTAPLPGLVDWPSTPLEGEVERQGERSVKQVVLLKRRATRQLAWTTHHLPS